MRVRHLSLPAVALLLALAAVPAHAGTADPTGQSIRALKDKQIDIRLEAIEALAGCREARAARALIPLLDDRTQWISMSANGALMRIGAPAVEPLLATLGNLKARGREEVAWVLGHIGDPRSVPPLIASLRDPDPDVRSAAATALGYLGDPRAIEALLPLLKDTELGGEAATALGRLGPAGREHLLAAVKDEDPSVRRRVVLALGYAKETRAIAPLAATLPDKDENVASAAAEALGRIGLPALDVLVAALDDPDPQVRSRTVGALSMIRGDGAIAPLCAAARDADPSVRLVAVRAIRCQPPDTLFGTGSSQPNPAASVLLAALADTDPEMRTAAMEAFASSCPAPPPYVLPPYITAALFPLLRDANPSLRNAAIQALSHPSCPEGLDAAAGLLADPNTPTRDTALAGLARARDPRAIPPLIEDLCRPPTDPPASPEDAPSGGPPGGPPEDCGPGRAHWAYAHPSPDQDLPAIGAAAVPALVALLQRPEPRVRALSDLNPSVRSQAATDLAGIHTPNAFDALARQVEDPNMWVTRAAVAALGSHGDPRAYPLLLAALNDPRADVRAAAVTALARPGGTTEEPVVHALQDRAWEVRLAAVLALQGVAPAGAADALAGRLEDPAQQVRQAAARALAARGDTRGVPVLLAALRTAEHDTDPVEALGMGKDARAVEPLIGLLDAGEDQMRVAAAAALGRIGDRRAEAPLRALSHHCSAEVRRAAAAALAALGCPAEAFPSPARQ